MSKFIDLLCSVGIIAMTVGAYRAGDVIPAVFLSLTAIIGVAVFFHRREPHS